MSVGALEFELADQIAFARLSGDFNPIHVDPEIARRELFGETVVHGIHVLFRALECVVKSVLPPTTLHIDSLKCRFHNPVFLGCAHEVRVVEAKGDSMRFEVRDRDGAPSLDAAVQWLAVRPGLSFPECDFGSGTLYEFASADDRSFANLRGLRGDAGLAFDRASFAERFPALAKHVDVSDLAQVLALTRIVGMKCPGMQSIFAGFALTRHDAASTDSRMAFRAEELDERLPRVVLAVRGPSLAGSVTTFVRPRAQIQPSAQEVAKRVADNAYAGRRAVILGGSRGVGEVTAKIIAAGGGLPILSYRRGLRDAEAVQADIREAGFGCEIFEFDVLDRGARDCPLEIADLGSLYYFPSPKIAKRRGGFDSQIFARYCDFYVRGFLDAVDHFSGFAPEGLRVFYPSSTMVEDHDTDYMEYAAAKQAGESVCGYLHRHSKSVSVHVERLTKLATDQTLSLIPSRRAPALDAMIDVVETVESLEF